MYAGRYGNELITNGTTIRAYDPATGERLWVLGPNSELAIATPVVSEDIIYLTAGYPPVRPVYAVRPGHRGDLSLIDGATASEAVAWSTNRGGTYIPTPIAYRGHLYTNANNGRLTCYDARTGEIVYRRRIGGVGGSYSASPVAADGKLYWLYPDFPKGINTMYPYILRGKLSVRPAQVGGIDVNTLLSKLSWLLRIPNVDRILPLGRGATVRQGPRTG